MTMKLNNQNCLSAALLSFAVIASATPYAAYAGSQALDLKQLYGADLRVAGLVERIDLKSGVILVSGQEVLISLSTRFSEAGADKQAIESTHGVGSLKIGDYVAVNGAVDSAAVLIVRLSEQYVPGSSTIYVLAPVKSIDTTTGVGKLSLITS